MAADKDVVASNAARYQHQIYTEKLEKEQDLFQGISPKVFENALIRNRNPSDSRNHQKPYKILTTSPNSHNTSFATGKDGILFDKKIDIMN
jgi:hypothetical protein